MTIGTTINTIALVANGAETTFNYPFLMPLASDAVVAYFPPGGTGVALSPTQYTITGIGNPSGGTVTYPLSGPPLAAGTSFIIARVLPLIQQTSVSAQGPTFAAIEQGLDYQMMVAQQLQQEINDLQFQIGSLTASTSSTSSTASTTPSVSPIASIAALRAYTGPVLAPLWLIGYRSVADGGEGMFAYNAADSTSADNSGTIILDGLGRRWYRETGGAPYSVNWFGATGNGVNDDTPEIQNCIAAAVSAVYFPYGTYRISDTLRPTRPFRFFGDGTSVSVISPSIGIIAIESFANGDVSFENLGFNYPVSATGGSAAIVIVPSVGSATGSSMRNISINGAGNGVALTNCTDFVMDSVFIYGFSTIGVLIQQSTNVVITNSGFYGSTASVVTSAVDWSGSGGFRMEGNTINTVVNGLLYNYSQPGTAGKLVVNDNAFEAVLNTAIKLSRSGTGSVKSVVIDSNAFHSCSTGLSIPTDATASWIQSLAVVGNAYYGLGTTADIGFAIDSSDNANIVGNAIASATTGATTIAVMIGSSASNVVVQSNNLSGTFSNPSIAVGGGATHLRVLDNLGFNPVGAAPLSPGASPWSYTSGVSPQTIYLSATTSINSVSYGGQAILPVPTSASASFAVQLDPNETIVISYSGALTANVMIH